MLRALLLSVALIGVGAAPASAQDDPFTVTGADGTVQHATAAEMAHWVDVAQRGGATPGQARINAFQLLVGYAWLRAEAAGHVFRVTRIHPAYDMPSEEAREQARFRLLYEKQVEGLDAFVTEFRAKWRARTVCARGWRSQRECGN